MGGREYALLPGLRMYKNRIGTERLGRDEEKGVEEANSVAREKNEIIKKEVMIV